MKTNNLKGKHLYSVVYLRVREFVNRSVRHSIVNSDKNLFTTSVWYSINKSVENPVKITVLNSVWNSTYIFTLNHPIFKR